MVFENLSDKLQNTLRKLKGKGKISERDVDEAMCEVKLALLEAGVNFKVVKNFVKKVKERSVSSEVMESLTPGQQVIKIVNEELTNLMGTSEVKLNFAKQGPAVILMCGPQSAGKTTTIGKLAKRLKKEGKRSLLVACDVYRPAAIKQLEIVSKQVGVPFFQMSDKIPPVDIPKAALEHTKKNGNNIVIIDAVGRLRIDEGLMEELKEAKTSTNPDDTLLVLDAMTDQDAVNVAQEFGQALNITGMILTKLDGDARGGAALSIRAVTDKPIKFVIMGEKMDRLEVSHPDRMASRILGMGDVLSLIGQARSSVDEKKVRELEEKLRSQSFTFDDFLDQLEQMKKMESIGELMGMILGLNRQALKDFDESGSEKAMKQMEAIIRSMTAKGRANSDIIDNSRRKRVVRGSGAQLAEVNRLIRQFKDLRKMMKQFDNFGKGKNRQKLKLPFPL